MKDLKHFKQQIHKCSKCGLCQAECPVYKITGNDCSVSRGHFLMLQGVLNGELKMSKTINRYLDLCLKCGMCSKFCPSGIDVVDVIVSAKSEYFRKNFFEKIITLLQKYFVFGLLPRIIRTFIRPTKSKQFEKKVLYFGGCGSKVKGDKSLVKILNSINIQVINPVFHCCGIPYFTRGDLGEFNKSIKSYIKILKKSNIRDVVTNCASCEKSLKDYIKWCDEADKEFLSSINVKNVYEYLRENKEELVLKEPVKLTYHKPCNIDNFGDIEWVLKNTKNLEYVEMQDYNKCCGLNALSKLKEYKIMKKLFNSKRKNINKTGCKIVATSCFGCEIALRMYSCRQYVTMDLLDFLASRV